jgi:hypothetical protein
VSSEITTPKLIGAFEKRTRFRRVESYLILLLMLSLLPLAGYVLSQAKDIAANDTSVDTTARQQKAEGKFSSDAHQLDGLRQQAGSVKITIPFISELDGKLTKEYSANYCRLTLIDAEGNLKSAMDVLSELKRNIDSNPIGCVPSSPGQTIDPGKPHFSLLLFNDNVYANNVPVDVLTFDASLLKDRFSKLINENNQTPLIDKGAIKALNAEYLSSMHTINVDNKYYRKVKENEGRSRNWSINWAICGRFARIKRSKLTTISYSAKYSSLWYYKSNRNCYWCFGSSIPFLCPFCGFLSSKSRHFAIA